MNKKAKIEKYGREEGKLSVHFSNNIDFLFKDEEETELNILRAMEEEYLNLREEMVNELIALNKKFNKVCDKGTVRIFLATGLLVGTTALSALFANIPIAILGYALACLSAGSSFLSHDEAVELLKECESLERTIDKNDLILDEGEVLNNPLTLDLIKEINPKLFKVVSKNKYALVPPLNINSVRRVPLEDLEEVLDQVYATGTQDEYVEEIVDIDEEYMVPEEPEKIETKIIQFGRYRKFLD